jgi:hypothetical protein
MYTGGSTLKGTGLFLLRLLITSVARGSLGTENFMRTLRLLLLVSLFCVCGTSMLNAASIGYSGKVFSEYGVPIQNGLVVIGTFAPTFDVGNYNCVYGDGFCNLEFGTAFDSAVSDGNFFPIDSTLTGTDGSFSGMGSTSAQAGTPLWMFAFEFDQPASFFQVLASSTDPSWQVPAQPSGSTVLSAASANIFKMGMSHQEGLMLTVVPFPEPSSLILLATSAAIVAFKR